MAKLSMLLGVLLIALGIYGYVSSDMVSKTALIPAYPGIVFFLMGLIGALKPAINKHVMHVSALLALLGSSGLAMGLPKVLKGEAGRAATSQTIMGVLCLVFLVLCIRSFIAARKARNAAGS